MAAELIICGISVYYSWNILSFCMIVAFIGNFQMSQGSVAWLYIPEVCIDAASGFAAGA